MSYLTQAHLSQDPIVRQRVAACVAREGIVTPHPVQWAEAHAWEIAAEPGFDDAYAYAIAGGKTPAEAGADEGVITDAMLLSAVQAIRAREDARTDAAIAAGAAQAAGVSRAVWRTTQAGE